MLTNEELQNKVMKLANGNPGAITAICEVLQISNSLQAFDFLRILEREGIKGPLIWVCYSDICKKDAFQFQLGILDGSLKTTLVKNEAYKWYIETGQP